ncbi:MAG: hypothetical protein NC094_12490 [Bacteroidales bacterium]|nr:hypothetical protein [Lachnoclostridium sp.]MCM1385502.1 hypothetical protein [Lachnoclostridium sp.]MCM1466226.1 hypothetical protein [Bacteroidales bacterium]
MLDKGKRVQKNIWQNVNPEKAAFLQKYHKDVQIVREGIENIEEIPDWWKKLLLAKKKEEKLGIAIRMWKECMGDLLKKTIAYMEENLTDVELITYKDGYSLLYSITSFGDKTLYYEGGNANEFFVLDELRRKWNAVPETIHNFYDNLHDGFFSYASSSIGLYRADNIIYLHQYSWSVVEELELSLQIDLESSFSFFGLEKGAYVAVDITDCEDDKAFLWFFDKEPQYEVNFWEMVDEWLVAAMKLEGINH